MERFDFAAFATSTHRTDPVNLFLAMDVDLSGRLSREELAALPAWGPPGKNWLAGVTQYVYFANGTGHLRAGYTYDTDRTGGGSPAIATPNVQTNADWAYKAHRISAGLGLPPLLTIKPNLAFDYYRQQYDNPNAFAATDTTRRRDNIFFFTATLNRDMTETLSVALEYNYTRDQSNVSVFDYNRSIFSLTLNGRF